MSCNAIMDLCPEESKFTLSQSGKSATLPCVFSGKYKSEHSIKIELVITNHSGLARLTDIEAAIERGELLRAAGIVQHIQYQDRATGREIDQLRLFAYDVNPCAEKEPIFSTVMIEGGVRQLSDTEIFKDHGTFQKAAFTLFSNPSSEFDRETYLNVYCTGYGEVAQKIERLKLKDKAHVIAQGKFEATSFGILGLRLFDVNYAHTPAVRKEKPHESKQN